MKKILIAATITGAVAAGLIIYLKRRNSIPWSLDDLRDSADEAKDDMDKSFRRAQRMAEPMIEGLK